MLAVVIHRYSTSSTCSSSVDSRSSSSQANTSSSCACVLKHGSIAQHVWYNEEAHMASSDVDLVEMRHSTVSRSLCDVFQLYVHVVFSFEQLSSVDLA